MPNSRQGVKIAFVGLNYSAQVACTQYLVYKHRFKRIDLDEPLRKFIRNLRVYGRNDRLRIDELRHYYDAIYRLDNDIFVNHFKKRVELSEVDVVTYDVRYKNELEVLKEMGFTIVRVYNAKVPRPLIGKYVKGAEKDTVALALLYDKRFAHNYGVNYSISFDNQASLKPAIDQLLTSLNYKLDIDS